MTSKELSELNELISPLILKGQPLNHIFAVHANEIPFLPLNALKLSVPANLSSKIHWRVRYKKSKKASVPSANKNLQ